MKYTVYNEEVLYTDEPVTRITAGDVARLKSLALKNVRQRLRLCAHSGVQDALHEMIIALPTGIYVRPHKHVGKSESFHIIEGCLKVVIFDEDGTMRNVLTMGTTDSDEILFYRLSESMYHTVVPQSPLVVFHEVTNGPFRREDTIYAPWTPEEQDQEGINAFMETLIRRIAQNGCN